MKLVIIIGPHAVGKMTVGQELAKITGLRLFHNHMTIELVRNFFSVHGSDEGKRLNNLFRQEIFRAVAKSDLPGMIFTYMWAFDMKSDWEYIENVEKIFVSRSAEVYYVELEADYNLRLERNRTENRLANKPSKRDLEHSEKLFTDLENKYRLNSLPGEIKRKNYLRIDNTNIEPEEAAQTIKDTFKL